MKTRRLLDGAIGVAAAVLLALVSAHVLPIGRPELLPATGSDSGASMAGSGAQQITRGPARSNRAAEGPALTEVIDGPRRQEERIDRDVIGIVDPETQSIYLLELQTARNTISRMRANY